MATDRTQVLIALDPPLLATALASVLRSWPLDVEVWDASDPRPVGCELAIVNGVLPVGVEALTVLSLPDIESGSGMALLREGDAWRPVPIARLDDLLGMVRHHVAA